MSIALGIWYVEGYKEFFSMKWPTLWFVKHLMMNKAIV